MRRNSLVLVLELSPQFQVSWCTGAALMGVELVNESNMPEGSTVKSVAGTSLGVPKTKNEEG